MCPSSIASDAPIQVEPSNVLTSYRRGPVEGLRSTTAMVSLFTSKLRTPSRTELILTCPFSIPLNSPSMNSPLVNSTPGRPELSCGLMPYGGQRKRIVDELKVEIGAGGGAPEKWISRSSAN